MSEDVLKPNFVTKSTEFYKIDSGVKSPNKDLGRTYYRLTCGNGDGYGYYEKGHFIMEASNVSIEKCGRDNPKSHNDVNTFSPAKIILAEKGDIVFQALGGDVILQGNNVMIYANGSEEGEGSVVINANNHFNAEGKEVHILATSNARFAAYNSVVVGGKVSTNINGGMVSMTEQSQISSDVLQSVLTGDIFSPAKFLSIFQGFLNNNVF